MWLNKSNIISYLENENTIFRKLIDKIHHCILIFNDSFLVLIKTSTQKCFGKEWIVSKYFNKKLFILDEQSLRLSKEVLVYNYKQ